MRDSNLQEPSWFSFDDREGKFDDQNLTACYIGKIYHLFQGRNAWNNVWSQTYPNIRAFWPSLNIAKQEVERRRTCGSTWTIEELPCLVLSGVEEAVIIAEINTDKPLSESVDVYFSRLSIEEIALEFEPKNDNSIYRFITWSETIAPMELPLRKHASRSSGSKRHRLGWNPEASNVQLHAVFRLASDINMGVQAVRTQKLKAMSGSLCEQR